MTPSRGPSTRRSSAAPGTHTLVRTTGSVVPAAIMAMSSSICGRAFTGRNRSGAAVPRLPSVRRNALWHEPGRCEARLLDGPHARPCASRLADEPNVMLLAAARWRLRYQGMQLRAPARADEAVRMARVQMARAGGSTSAGSAADHRIRSIQATPAPPAASHGDRTTSGRLAPPLSRSRGWRTRRPLLGQCLLDGGIESLRSRHAYQRDDLVDAFLLDPIELHAGGRQHDGNLRVHLA